MKFGTRWEACATVERESVRQQIVLIRKDSASIHAGAA